MFFFFFLFFPIVSMIFFRGNRLGNGKKERICSSEGPSIL